MAALSRKLARQVRGEGTPLLRDADLLAGQCDLEVANAGQVVDFDRRTVALCRNFGR